jgi:hypothetical protein
VDDCGCLENSWVNSPGGSNPSPSVPVLDEEVFSGYGYYAASVIWVLENITLF